MPVFPATGTCKTTSACGDGYGLAFLARCLDRSSAHEKFLIQSLLFSEFLIFSRLQIRPVLKKIGKGAVSLLEEIRISGTDVWEVESKINEAPSIRRIILGKQALYRSFGLKAMVAIIEIPIRKCQIYHLVKRLDVSRAVVPNRLKVGRFEQIQSLQQCQPLRPASQLVNLNPFVGYLCWFLNLDRPIRKILDLVRSAYLLESSTKSFCDVSPIKVVIASDNRGLPVLAHIQRCWLRIDQLLQRIQKVRLTPDFAGPILSSQEAADNTDLLGHQLLHYFHQLVVLGYDGSQGFAVGHVHLPLWVFPHKFALGFAIREILVAPHQNELVRVLDGFHIGVRLPKDSGLWRPPILFV